MGLGRLAVPMVDPDTAVEAVDESPSMLQREFDGRIELISRFKLFVCASAALARASKASMEALVEFDLLEAVGARSAFGLFSRMVAGREHASARVPLDLSSGDEPCKLSDLFELDLGLDLLRPSPREGERASLTTARERVAGVGGGDRTSSLGSAREAARGVFGGGAPPRCRC